MKRMYGVCAVILWFISGALGASDMISKFEAANALLRADKRDEAIEKYNQFLQEYPQCQQAYYNRGVAYAGEKEYAAARASFNKALDCDPVYLKPYVELAKIDVAENNIEQAILHYKHALRIKPDLASAHHGLAKIYCNQDKLDLAIQEYKEAIAYDPKNPELLMDYGNVLSMAQKNEEALQLFLQLHEMRPQDMNVYYNVAYAYKRLEQFDKAIPIYEELIEKRPNNAEIWYGLGTAYLVLGEWDLGWQGYESRWEQSKAHKPNYPQPIWDGSRLDDKTLFVVAEQGLGDTFQSIRFARVAKEKFGAKRVIAAVQRPLVTLLKLCPYIDEVVELGNKPEKFDTYISTMSFPYVLHTTEETIPVQIPYLYADQKLVAQWRQKLESDNNFRVGLCWQGNPNYSTHFLRTAVAAKSITPAMFAKLGHIKGVSFYSLQKEHAANVDEALPDGFIIHEFDGDFDQTHGRFMDTAAVMKNLDLIITVDTSIAHLAGGLGCSTWVLLPKPADWRWLLERDDSPWYPTIRLFRQKTTADWDAVIEDLARELAPLARAHTVCANIRVNGRARG